VTPAALTANLVALVLFASECGGDDGGDELASLDGSSWILVEGEGITIPGAVMPTIAFEAGRVSGSGGCNRFTGSYEEEGETLSLGMLASTRMACAEDVMRAETAYLSALESVSSWSGNRGELVLSDSSGRTLLRYEAGMS
jgi:putative lipoprotein